MGCDFERGFRCQPDFVFAFERVLAVGAAARSGRLFYDGSNGVVKHARSINGARQSARSRDGGLLDDVYGNGAFRRFARRLDCRKSRCPNDCQNRRRGLHFRRNSFRFAAARAQKGSQRNHRRAQNERRRTGGRCDSANRACAKQLKNLWNEQEDKIFLSVGSLRAHQRSDYLQISCFRLLIINNAKIVGFNITVSFSFHSHKSANSGHDGRAF